MVKTLVIAILLLPAVSAVANTVVAIGMGLSKKLSMEWFCESDVKFNKGLWDGEMNDDVLTSELERIFVNSNFSSRFSCAAVNNSSDVLFLFQSSNYNFESTGFPGCL